METSRNAVLEAKRID